MSSYVITGASSGIGAAIANALSEEGRTLILNGRDRAALDAVAKDVEQLGAQVEVLPADLNDDAQLNAFAAQLPDEVDCLIHSAGVALLGNQADLPVADLDLQYRVNVRAPFLLTQALLPNLRAARGLVVFVNSGAGQNAKAGWGGYAASKFALRALADSLRDEESDAGVRVTSIYPGRTATPMQREVRVQEGGEFEPENYLRPEDVARMVAQVVRLPAGATVPDLSVRPR